MKKSRAPTPPIFLCFVLSRLCPLTMSNMSGAIAFLAREPGLTRSWWFHLQNLISQIVSVRVSTIVEWEEVRHQCVSDHSFSCLAFRFILLPQSHDITRKDYRARVRTDYSPASVPGKGREYGVRPVLGKRRTDWTLRNTSMICRVHTKFLCEVNPRCNQHSPFIGSSFVSCAVLNCGSKYSAT